MHVTLALLLLAASPEATTNNSGNDTTEVKPAKVKKICRAGAATGSRMTSKICKTQAEWDAQLGADSTKLDSQRNSSAGY